MSVVQKCAPRGENITLGNSRTIKIILLSYRGSDDVELGISRNDAGFLHCLCVCTGSSC